MIGVWFAAGVVALMCALWMSALWSAALRSRARCELLWSQVAAAFNTRADAAASFASAAAAHTELADAAADLAEKVRVARRLGSSGRPAAEVSVAAAIVELWELARPFATTHRQLAAAHRAIEESAAPIGATVTPYNRCVAVVVAASKGSATAGWVSGHVFTGGLPLEVPAAATR